MVYLSKGGNLKCDPSRSQRHQIASTLVPPSKDHMSPRVSQVTVWQLETARLNISLYFCAFLLLSSDVQGGSLEPLLGILEEEP